MISAIETFSFWLGEHSDKISMGKLHNFIPKGQYIGCNALVRHVDELGASGGSCSGDGVTHIRWQRFLCLDGWVIGTVLYPKKLALLPKYQHAIQSLKEHGSNSKVFTYKEVFHAGGTHLAMKRLGEQHLVRREKMAIVIEDSTNYSNVLKITHFYILRTYARINRQEAFVCWVIRSAIPAPRGMWCRRRNSNTSSRTSTASE